jgi:hypothetical protein
VGINCSALLEAAGAAVGDRPLGGRLVIGLPTKPAVAPSCGDARGLLQDPVHERHRGVGLLLEREVGGGDSPQAPRPFEQGNDDEGRCPSPTLTARGPRSLVVHGRQLPGKLEPIAARNLSSELTMPLS